MAWDLTELRRGIVLDFADAQSLLEQRANSVWWHVHACYVRNQQLAKKRWSLRALRKRLFRRAAVECKNPKCRVRFVPYRADTLYCTVQCRVRSLALAAYYRRRVPKPARTCPVCQTTFMRRRSDAIYCGWRCKQSVTAGEQALRRQHERAAAFRTCRHCEGPIVGRRLDAVFCSSRCSDAVNWAKYVGKHREALNARVRAAYHRDIGRKRERVNARQRAAYRRRKGVA